ncbi:methyltransferase [Glutamicibacter sp.]|uniref:class I SAM-dependent methyltransferase n=1 Tax=Glutamicibacter sp. TaxID=1931995 RepID=UPI0028BEB502|nr:methyltransferase [Glutamicibacter sp.]
MSETIELDNLLAALRRWPDVVAPNLFAVDAADRLLLDTCDAQLAADGSSWERSLSVVGDHYGALTLGALALGARQVLVHTDSLTSRRAIEANARRLLPDLVQRIEFRPLQTVAADSTLLLMALPRGLDVLAEQVHAIAAAAAPELVLHAGGRIKHMNRSMNQVFDEHFARLDVSLARQKSRVLTARRIRDVLPASRFPVSATHSVAGVDVNLRAGAATFGSARLDPGTRLLLEHLPDLSGAERLLDLACGNGSIGIVAALRYPRLRVDASDHSASAVASTRAGAQANGLAERITVVQDDGLSRLPDASAQLITLNPPFHIGNTVTADIAFKLIDEAARVLADGGQLICVFNSHLRYRGELERRVGPTQQLARDKTFTVTASTRVRSRVGTAR